MTNKPKDIGTRGETAVVRLCQRCGAPRPKGRVKYCGDVCASAARIATTRAKDDKRLAACQRCQGSKEPGTRGGKYCAPCRLIVADVFAQEEYERARRRSMTRTQEKLDAGEHVRNKRLGVQDGEKWCARCQAARPLASFAARKDANKPSSYCIPCQRSYNRERRMLLHYGLSYDEYEMLAACQDYRCAICGGRPRRHALSVDHNHETG